MDTNDILDQESAAADGPQEPLPTAPPIESRFMFVDVAAMRAKQLRRGARPRLDDGYLASLRVQPHKPERVAMEEVKRNLVLWDLNPPKPVETLE